MEVHRRKFIAGVGAVAASVPLVASCSQQNKADGKFASLPLDDQRVKEFVQFRADSRTDPVKAVKDYTREDLVYTSSAGVDFNQDGLARRINDWVRGFTLNDTKPLWAASLGADTMLLAIEDNLVSTGEFRGNQPSDKPLRTESIFVINYDDQGKISRYTNYTDYGGVAEAIGAERMAELQGIQ